jgi:hypothetical protein
MKFLVNWVKSPQQMGESTIEGNSAYLDNGSLVIQTKSGDEPPTLSAIYAPGCWSSCVEVKDATSDAQMQ